MGLAPLKPGCGGCITTWKKLLSQVFSQFPRLERHGKLLVHMAKKVTNDAIQIRHRLSKRGRNVYLPSFNGLREQVFQRCSHPDVRDGAFGKQDCKHTPICQQC